MTLAYTPKVTHVLPLCNPPGRNRSTIIILIVVKQLSCRILIVNIVEIVVTIVLRIVITVLFHAMVITIMIITVLLTISIITIICIN